MIGSPYKIAGIYAVNEWIVTNHSIVTQKNIPIFETTHAEMQRISSLTTPSPLLAVIEIPACNASAFSTRVKGLGLELALDDIRDPGNMGTIIRIADWFGISVIWCSENCVDIYNPKVVQATMGSIARVEVVYGNLKEILKEFKKSGDGQVYGAYLEGDSIYNDELIKPGIVVIGNESRGISQELEPFVTRKIFIPSYGGAAGSKAESLNASVATAIICAEFRRKMK